LSPEDVWTKGEKRKTDAAQKGNAHEGGCFPQVKAPSEGEGKKKNGKDTKDPAKQSKKNQGKKEKKKRAMGAGVNGK